MHLNQHLDDLIVDLRLAARALLRTSGFTVVAVASLGLGVALTASIMAIVNAYLVRSMPFPAADRLYHVLYAPIGQPEPRGMSSLDWNALRDVVELADGSAPTRFYLGEGGDREESLGLMVAAGSLEMLGVRIALGRSLVQEDFRPEAEPVALISETLWKQRFAKDPNIVGRYFRATRSTDGGAIESFRIIGVLPPDFRYVRDYARGEMEFVVPLRTPLRAYMVRLREGVPIAFAERRISDAVTRAASSFPPNWSGVRLESVHDRYVSGLRPVLLAITVTAGLVLVIVCVNLAVLILLRTMRRQKELAVRVALGAGRAQIGRILAAEAFVICGAALTAGLALSALSLRMLAPLIEERLGRGAPGGTSAISIDSTVLLVVGVASILIALSLSFVPLLAPWRRQLANTLRGTGRTGVDAPAMRRVRSSLIGFEVAASLALLVGCGLMIRSVVNLVRTDLGFRTDQVMRARIALPPGNYPDASSFLRFYDRLTQRLAEVSSTPFALAGIVPFFEAPKQPVEVDGRAGSALDAGVVAAGDRYLDLLGINLQRGRGFTAGDREGSEPVALVSETLARRLWPDGSAIGRRIRTTDQPEPGAPASPWRTIVGVVRDVHQTYTDTDLNDVYVPFLQAPTRYAPIYFKTDRPPSAWLETLRTTAAEIDPDVLITGRITGNVSLEDEADRQLAGPRFLMSVLAGFAIFALLLAVLGIFGVTAYAVQQREREVAIRIAVGATRRAVIALFLRDGVLVLSAGMAGGLLGAIVVSRILQNQLHGVQRFDPFTLFAACLCMTVCGLLATWNPARRAAGRSPMVVLKES